ncbi:MAG: sulfite exporter TauE/SafE family protein [Acidimicrobiales bacterium]
MELIAVAVIGLGIGFLGGLFGKGGAAIATPLLYAIGIPAAVAVAAPLPATIPSTMAASIPYRRAQLVDQRVVSWSIAFGIPATALGALLTLWVDAANLVRVTDLVLVALGLRLLLRPERSDHSHPAASRARLAAVAIAVGLSSGLLANSGGFLLAPLYVAVVKLPIKPAFASSLVVAAALAIPGTAVHAALGHIDWSIVGVFAVTSVPLAFLGAHVALRTEAGRLERAYGLVLAVLGSFFLLWG